MDTFSPVVKITSIRVILSLVAFYDLEAILLDVKTTFLNGVLTEAIYMELPEGLEWLEEVLDPEMVCLLLRALYGLKQSSRLWYKRIDTFLLSIGFGKCIADSNVYYCESEGKFVILALYVDDCILASNNINMLAEVKKTLMKEFEMSDLGNIHNCLGMEISRNR